MADVVRARVAVIGGGPAGIAAAVRSAEAGADTILLDEGAAPGGQIWRGGGAVSPLPRRARRWLERLIESGARSVRGVAVASLAPGRLQLDTTSGPAELAYDALVLATGARELFLPFPGWTLPNVIGVGAAQALVKSGASMEGRRIVVAGAGPLLLAAAAALTSAGGRVAVVAEQAPSARVRAFTRGLARSPGKLLEAARYLAAALPARYRTGTWVAAARGDDRVREAVLSDGNRFWTERCDVLCCSYGLVPNLELPRHLACNVSRDAVIVDEIAQTTVPRVFAAGEITGIAGVESAVAEGEIAGLAAAGRTDVARSAARNLDGKKRFVEALAGAFAPRPELLRLADAGTLVCRCEDVKLADLDPHWTVRQAKLYTRAGMGPCQGRVCGPAFAQLFGWDADRVRPPLRPIAIASLAMSGGDEG